MAVNSNIAEMIKRFERLAAEGRALDVTAALTQGVNAGRAAMLNRIFNQGKDTEGVSLGIYTKPYANKRRKKGRQTTNKDLEFTGSLRRAIVTANAGENRVVCVINNQKEKLIAQYQEEQIGKKRGTGKAVIFSPNKNEGDIVKDQTNKALNQLYVRLFNS